jgi:hypothetical protein
LPWFAAFGKYTVVLLLFDIGDGDDSVIDDVIVLVTDIARG